MLRGAKAFLDQVNRHGRLHYFTCFFASYASILSSNDGFGEFNGQWVFEDLLLHEMKAFLPGFGCCKNHLLRSLELVRNPPIDVQCLSTVSCSLVCFKCSMGQKSFQQVSPHGRLHYFTCFFASYASILSSNDGFGEFNGQWVFEDLLLHEMKASLTRLWMCKHHLWRSFRHCQESFN